MKLFLRCFLFLFLIPVMTSAQTAGNYVFFKGDTLKGFDIQATYNEALAQHLDAADIRGYMKMKERNFVRQKYNIPVPAPKSFKSAVPVNPGVLATCNNVNFETGAFAPWTGSIGNNNNSTSPLTIGSAGISSGGPNAAETSCSYQTLVNTGTDPYSGLPMVDPGGGTWACRLGGEYVNTDIGTCTSPDPFGFESAGEILQQTFPVTAANAMFTYNYMAVLEQANGGSPHSVTQCPYFRVQVLDQNGDTIPCFQYYVESTGNAAPAGMLTSSQLSNTNAAPVYYSPWTTNSLDLRTYIGTNVTVVFTAAGCTLGGHFGYAYIDCTCGPTQILASSPPVCLGGSVSLTAPAAITGSTYTWNTMPSGTAGIVGSTTGQTVTINANGTYQVTVIQRPGCQYIIDTTITFYPNPTLTLASTNPTCNPGHNGTATATVTGGNAPLTYSWSPAPGAGQGTANATGMNAGTYSLTVTTTNGCTTSGSVTLASPGGAPTVSLTSTPATCSPGNDGTATATVTGGTGPFTYTWTPAPAGGQGTTSATGLNGGTYTFVVNGPVGTCSDTNTVVVTQPNGPTATGTGTNVICFGQSNGTATINATGGTAPLTYAWTAPATGTANTTTGLAAGTYTCVTSDSKGCSVTTTVVITQPTVLAVTATGVAATCNGKCNGQLICIPTGGTTTYTYSWSSGSTLPSVSNICAGTYTATITDAHGCIATDTALVQQPTPLVMSVFPGKTHCSKSDGMDSATVSGGTPGYTYSWSPGAGSASSSYHNIPAGTYTVYIKDNNGCPDSIASTVTNLPGVNIVVVAHTNVSCAGGNNGTARDSASGGFKPYTFNWTPAPAVGQGTLSISSLTAGIYTCTVTDSAGCTNSVPVTITQPTPVTVASGPAKICLGSCTTLSATGSGGTPAYTYTWAQGATILASLTVCPLVTTTYTVVCTDANGCLSPPLTETVHVDPPLEILAAGAKSVCPGTAVQLNSTASGGDSVYSYVWMPTTGLSNPNISNPIATPAVTTTYTVIVSDNCGTPTDSDYVTVTVYPLPVVSFTSKDTVVCAPVCATFVGSSNPPCTSGTWTFGDSGTGVGCDTVRHCYYTAGTYNVTYNVTDIHGCKGSATVPNFIDALPLPVASFTDAPNPANILDPTVLFTDLSTNAVGWSWTFGDPSDSVSNKENPYHTYADTGCYTVKLVVVAPDGCKDSTTRPVCIQPIFTFYAPNTFTPNGDGKNDVWMPFGIGIDPNDYDLMMFDRWGNLMFETHTWGQGWDGRANGGPKCAQIDTYVWKVALKDVMGNKHAYTGRCNLIK